MGNIRPTMVWNTQAQSHRVTNSQERPNVGPKTLNIINITKNTDIDATNRLFSHPPWRDFIDLGELLTYSLIVAYV